jgi:hypothetical protein
LIEALLAVLGTGGLIAACVIDDLTHPVDLIKGIIP